MKTFYRFSIVMIALLALPITSQATVWNIDPNHSDISFRIQHMMVSHVKGSFQNIEGVINTNDKDATKTQVAVTIDINSINTNQANRDNDLRSANFFDVAKYPVATFVSQKITKTGKDYTVTGELTLHGVTKMVVLKSEEPSKESRDLMGNLRRGISASTKISRKDFGIIWNKALETGGVLIGDEVEISIDIEGIKE